MPWPRGVPQSPEHRAKNAARLRAMNEARRGVPLSPERRETAVRNLVPGNRAGQHQTDEWREQTSARHTGVPRQPFPIIGECVYCGDPATEQDHVLPKKRGGTDDPGNLVDSCHGCNSSKRQRTPEEWLAAGLYQTGGIS